MLYVLITGHPPFAGDEDSIFEQIRSGNVAMNWSEPVWDSISEDCKDLLRNKLLAYSQDRRASARRALAHPWFKNAPSSPVDKQLMKDTLNNLKTF